MEINDMMFSFLIFKNKGKEFFLNFQIVSDKFMPVE